MAYRDDVEALQARHAALEAEVVERERTRDEVARMLVEVRAREETERRLADLAAGGPAHRRRRRILIAAVVSVLALLGAGVAYRLARPERDRMAEAIERFSIYTDQMCGCSDSACTRQVSEAMERWIRAMPQEDRDSPRKLDEAQKTRLMDLSTRMSQCMAKHSSAPE